MMIVACFVPAEVEVLLLGHYCCRWRYKQISSAMPCTPAVDLKFKLNGRFPNLRTRTIDSTR